MINNTVKAAKCIFSAEAVNALDSAVLSRDFHEFTNTEQKDSLSPVAVFAASSSECLGQLGCSKVSFCVCRTGGQSRYHLD